MVSVLAERLFESLYFGKAGPVYYDCFVLFTLVSLNTRKQLSTITKTHITETHITKTHITNTHDILRVGLSFCPGETVAPREL